jgi:hypothetical protein
MLAAPRQFDVIVLGAGAAGLMCAAVAGGRGRRVVVLDHNGQPGRKILVSGGGRCNFTNLRCGPENYLSENPHFVKSALALYQPQDFIELVERHGIAWHEKTLGQIFCDGSARSILDMLLAECERGGVEVVLNAHQIAVETGTSGFRVASSAGEFRAGALVVATGGASIPELGATAMSWRGSLGWMWSRRVRRWFRCCWAARRLAGQSWPGWRRRLKPRRAKKDSGKICW